MPLEFSPAQQLIPAVSWIATLEHFSKGAAGIVIIDPGVDDHLGRRVAAA